MSPGVIGSVGAVVFEDVTRVETARCYADRCVRALVFDGAYPPGDLLGWRQVTVNFQRRSGWGSSQEWRCAEHAEASAVRAAAGVHELVLPDDADATVHVAHGLGTRELMVMVFEPRKPWRQVLVQWDPVDDNTVELRAARPLAGYGVAVAPNPRGEHR